tara:strand:+ start:20153 stop:20674 length:522 start_codon:yes stop_codon:yes gene_type:complete
MNLIKKLSWVFALILAIGPIAGCALFDRHEKNSEGYYPRHFYACGPVALEKSILESYKRRGIAYCTRAEELSKQIQSYGMLRKELLSYFNKEAIGITWPSEIEKVANNHGFDLIKVDDINSLNPQEDIAIVLIHGKFFSHQYHWVVYPIDDVKNYYGKKTVIDIIYLLKWKGE